MHCATPCNDKIDWVRSDFEDLPSTSASRRQYDGTFIRNYRPNYNVENWLLIDRTQTSAGRFE